MVRPESPRERLGERGFTLIELMVVVIIIAILAAVVVPTFIGEAKKVNASSEVNPMFAELSTKEERNKNENNVYAAVAKCPATPSTAGTAASTCAATWTPLGIIAPETTVKCVYEVIAGLSTDDPATAVFDPVGAVYAPPAGCCGTSWYLIHAACDMDNDGVLSHYVTASFDSKMQMTAHGE